MYYGLIVILCTNLWSPPINLGIPGVDDLMHQAGRQFHQYNGRPTCLVWQVNINGNLDIFSRFSTEHVPHWGDTIRITTDAGSDINPTVAYGYHQGHYWCVWQNNSSGNWDIYIAYNETYHNPWEVPYQLTVDSVDEEHPSICVIHDTVWVVWQASDNGAINIFSRYYDGVSWSPSAPITTDSVYNNIYPKINQRSDHPFVVWERNEDIYYSEYTNGNWQTPQPIAPDSASDNSPEIAVSPGVYAVWVTWQSDRDGNFEIYSTGYDSLNVYRRLTFSDSSDVSPSPLYCLFLWPPRDEDSPGIAFSTDRNGNYDIYTIIHNSYAGWDTICCVDSNPAADIRPVMCGDGFNAWVLWQTDRNGDWDIYGSWVRVDAIEENHGSQATLSPMFVVTPNPFSDKTHISFGIVHGAKSLKLNIYNAAGRLVKSFSPHTTYTLLPTVVSWDGTDSANRKLPSGVYFLRFQTGDRIETKKLLLIR